MPACPNCGYENAAEARICAQCAHPLGRAEPGPDKKRATPEYLPVTEPGGRLSRQPDKDLSFLDADAVALYIEGDEAPLVLHFSDQVILGRYTPDAVVPPDVDLTPYAALEKGVSRR